MKTKPIAVKKAPERVKGSGHTRYHLSQAKKDTRPTPRGRP